MAVKKIKETVEFQVEFYDVDSMQVAWHGNYVKFMEVARCALLRKIGYDYNEMTRSGYIWPVVDLHIKYIRPMIFMQRIRAEVTLVEYEVCMKLSYKFMDAETGAESRKYPDGGGYENERFALGLPDLLCGQGQSVLGKR